MRTYPHHPNTIAFPVPAPTRRPLRERYAALRELLALLFLFTGALGAGYILVWRPLLERLGM